MNEKEKELFDFLDEKKAQVLSEVKELASQDRMDESNVLKAKANIYDICKAVFTGARCQNADQADYLRAGHVYGDNPVSSRRAEDCTDEAGQRSD